MANSPSGDSATARLVRVLETFTPARTVQTTSEIGRRAGLPRSSAHRIVGELVAAGLLERDDDRRVRIGMRLWELATRSSSALRLPWPAQSTPVALYTRTEASLSPVQRWFRSLVLDAVADDEHRAQASG